MDKSQLSRLRLPQELQSSTGILGDMFGRIFCRLFKEPVQELCTGVLGDMFGIASTRLVWRSFNEPVEECNLWGVLKWQT